MTSGLDLNRKSKRASGMIIGVDCWIVCVQNEISRGVSQTESPCLDLNHWRLLSINEIAVIGTFSKVFNKRVILSKPCSGPVSSTS